MPRGTNKKMENTLERIHRKLHIYYDDTELLNVLTGIVVDEIHREREACAQVCEFAAVEQKDTPISRIARLLGKAIRQRK